MKDCVSINELNATLRSAQLSTNPGLALRCLLLALHSTVGEQSQVAREFGVTRAAVCKWTRRFLGILNLDPPAPMFSPEAVADQRERTLRTWARRPGGKTDNAWYRKGLNRAARPEGWQQLSSPVRTGRGNGGRAESHPCEG